jgi:hypothetical protein
MEEADRQQDNIIGSEQKMGRQAAVNTAQHLQRSTSRKRRQGGEPDRQVVKSLMDMLNSCENPLVKRFRMASERLASPESPEVSIRLLGQEGTDHDTRYLLS